MKLHLQVCLKNRFPVMLAASASLYQFRCKKIIFRLFVKFMYQDQQHAFIDITMIIRGEIKVLLCFP